MKSIVARMSQGRELEAAGHPAPAIGKQREMNASASLLSSFYAVQNPSSGSDAALLGLGSRTSVNLTNKWV